MPIAATRTPAFKFIKELQGPGSEELYDLKADPHEQVDLARRDPADAAPFRQGLVAWCQAFEKARIHSQSVALSEEHKERLRALGYLK